MTITTEVIEQDHRLEGEASRANGALAQHRWHWTLDKSNPDRVSFAEYGRAVGRHENTVAGMANGYAETTDNPGLDIQSAVQLQSVKQADREIVHAVAKAKGISVVNTRQHHRADVDRVRNVVAERREETADWTQEKESETVEKAASMVAAEAKAEKTAAVQRAKSVPLLVGLIEGSLVKARDALTKALSDAKLLDANEVDEALTDGLTVAVDQVIALAKLVQSALGHDVDIDWDAELAKIGGQR